MSTTPLKRHPGRYSVYRLPPAGSAQPDHRGAQHPTGTFSAVLHAPGEITVVQDEELPSPANNMAGTVARSGPWVLLSIDAVLPHDAIGILARMSAVLADAGIPIFVLSTYDTDYVLIPAERERVAREALVRSGYSFTDAE